MWDRVSDPGQARSTAFVGTTSMSFGRGRALRGVRDKDPAPQVICSLPDHDVCSGEISPLRKQRFSGSFCQSVGKAVAKIESRWVPSLSVLPPGRAREVGLFSIDGHDLQIGADDEKIELAAGGFSLSAFDNHSRLQHSRGRNQSSICHRNGSQESVALRFGKEDRCQR